MPTVVLTVGHSNRPLAELVDLLRSHDVRRVVDIRRIPLSRRNPQFNRDTLAAALTRCGLEYRHIPDLGGLRRPLPDSENTAWREAWFRGYADHMQSPVFQRALAAALEAAGRECTVLLCAEASPWNCHRSLVADALVTRGYGVEHILGLDERVPHRLNPAARVVEGRVIYPVTQLILDVET